MKDPELALANMRENLKRKHTAFIGMTENEEDFVPVCGGPSVGSRLKEIRARQKIGGRVVACNGARQLLLDNGIKPDMVAFCDPSPVVTGFIDEPDDLLYLVGSICHPSVFEKLDGCRVIMWHPDIGYDEQKEILDLYPDVPSCLVGGGSTIGLRMLNFGFVMGYRRFHFYGLDGSYADDGADHAYTKHDGPETDRSDALFNGKRYFGSRWMFHQAGSFVDELYPRFTSEGCQIHVHGEGLIPEMVKALHERARLAA